MAVYINPSFRRYPDEASLVGHILAAFGEIEVSVCFNTAIAHKIIGHIMTTLYSIRTTSTRIETALHLMKPAAEIYDLLDFQQTVTPLIWYCVKIRNQYAHCNWADDAGGGGLFFADLQNSATNPGFTHDWKHLDPPLLQAQLEFLNSTMDWLNFINGEIIHRQGESKQPNPWSVPSIPCQPPLHNPPAEHVPRWLSEDDKALHLAKAQAALGGPPTPTPKQLELDKAREEKKDARRLHAIRSAGGDSAPSDENSAK